jgi:hypothetical protein
VAILAEFPDTELSAFELFLVDEAARQLIQATLTKRDEIRVRMTRNGLALIERIRRGQAARQAASPITKFDEYLKQRAG